MKGTITKIRCIHVYDGHKEDESLQSSIRTQMQHSYQCVEDQQWFKRIGKEEAKSSVTACMKQVKEALKIAKYLLHTMMREECVRVESVIQWTRNKSTLMEDQ